ncbi:MAG: hypothetical protein Q8S11_08220, partial [Daejeonella sp.]|uniref:hypothetical protein n=1 Tax=Daejeonella sp. TaxID=2805397 RepID=UPI002733EC4B
IKKEFHVETYIILHRRKAMVEMYVMCENYIHNIWPKQLGRRANIRIGYWNKKFMLIESGEWRIESEKQYLW